MLSNEILLYTYGFASDDNVDDAVAVRMGVRAAATKKGTSNTYYIKSDGLSGVPQVLYGPSMYDKNICMYSGVCSVAFGLTYDYCRIGIMAAACPPWSRPRGQATRIIKTKARE